MKTDEKKDVVSVTVLMPRSLYERLKAFARDNFRSLSAEIVRRLTHERP